MQFSDIIGQNHLKQELRDTITNNRISHALLFHGPEGNGALPLAIAYAQYINCENRTVTDSCGVCASCVKYNKLQHPDLHFAYPVITTTKIKSTPVSDNFIAEWREVIQQQPYLNLEMWLTQISGDESSNKQGSIQKEESKEIIRKLNLKSYEAEYKVMIIWMADKINESCANKLLKIIEEPPAKTLFILISENTEDIISTILSRTQMVRVPKIDNTSLAARISQDFGIDSNDIDGLLHNANGNYLKAFRLISLENSNSIFFELFTQMMRLAYTKNLPELSLVSDKIADLGREKQKSYIEYCLKMLRENFILNQKNPDIVYLFKKEKDFSDKFHPYINEKNIGGLTKDFNDAFYHIERNGSAKIIFFDIMLKLIIHLRT